MNSNSQQSDTYQKLRELARETAVLTSIDALLQWDERTMMPQAGAEYRAEQIGMLARMIHARRTDPRLKDWLDELEDDPFMDDVHGDAATTVRWIRRDFERQTKLPASLVEEISRSAIQGQQIWARAREARDFAMFKGILQHLVELKQQEAEAIGYEHEAYDALLDEYEPSARTADVAEVLDGLRAALVPLVQRIADATRKISTEAVQGHFPAAAQAAYGKQMAARIGFDFARGRLDVTDHPFCSGMGPHDCRITTRYDESFFPSAFFGIMHEAGHGIYEQGLRADECGLPPGAAVSLGIHESQSRLWENQVGRSRAFWEYALPIAREHFPELDAGLDEVYAAMNLVEPSLIRVEADEVTYNLHIIIRFELERDLISGQLNVDDLPEAWNQKYEHYLGVRPAHDGDGVLQDIHWSGGAIGYFSTYSLGNLYGAQLFETANQDLGGVAEQIRQGEFQPLHAWLTEHVYQHGQCYMPAELVENATGKPLSHEPLISYLEQKLGELYGL